MLLKDDGRHSTELTSFVVDLTLTSNTFRTDPSEVMSSCKMPSEFGKISAARLKF